MDALSAVGAACISTEDYNPARGGTGQVVFHKPVTAEFVLKNDGHKPLVINNVLKSCGCTEVDYPKTSIAAGESFVIKAVYDAKQMGTFTKQVCSLPMRMKSRSSSL